MKKLLKITTSALILSLSLCATSSPQIAKASTYSSAHKLSEKLSDMQTIRESFVKTYNQLAVEVDERNITNDPFKNCIDEILDSNSLDITDDNLEYAFWKLLGGEEWFSNNLPDVFDKTVNFYVSALSAKVKMNLSTSPTKAFIKEFSPDYLGGALSELNYFLGKYSKIKISNIPTKSLTPGTPWTVTAALTTKTKYTSITHLGNVMWYSDNPEIVSVYRGELTPHKKGKTKITVILGDFVESFNVTVK